MSSNNLCDPTNLACRTSLFNPVDTAFGGISTGYNPSNSTRSTNHAVYAFDQVKFNEFFELLGSVRHDTFKTDFENLALALPDRYVGRTDNMTSWRAGAVVHPTPNSSAYAAYGISYNPSAEFGTLSSSATNAASVLLPPEKNRIIEVGAKADVLGGKLSLTGAVFRIEKTNMRIPNDPTTNTYLVLDGLARVDGLELGAAGKLTDRWQVIGGYSYLDSEIVKTSNLAELGREIPSTPRHNFTVWTTYDVTPLWTIGGGAIYQSDAFVNTANTAYVPSYWRFDAMASYKVTRNSTLQLNLYNLTDAFYFAQYYQGHAVPASGRSAILPYRVRVTPSAAPAPKPPT
jgi:catecholate siderophore receptor